MEPTAERPADDVPNARSNLARLLDGEAPDWIPFSIDVAAVPGLTEPVDRVFRRQTGAEDPSEFFGCDWRLHSLAARFGGDDPSAWHGALPPGATFDEWGIGHHASGAEGTVERTFAPLAAARSIDDVAALPDPVILDDRDPSAVARFHAAGYPVFGYAGSIYEWSWWLRGMQEFMVDLIESPKLARAVIDKVAGHTERLSLASAAAGIDVLCYYDDAGTQRGMQISPRLWREFIRPAWQRVLTRVRRDYPGVRFFLHSCGNIEAIVPDVIELGFHVLHPVQPECMDLAAVHRQYGERIALAATISAQRTFPFGSPDDVRAEVHRLARLIGPRRRAILMPSNRIQPETPWENIVAFAEAAREVRRGML